MAEEDDILVRPDSNEQIVFIIDDSIINCELSFVRN